ncbi:MAG: hypothetical protein IPM35_18195 [Myxococcales bacterium]|nr:hypothetical protein [Myxococcales bacterium]
MGSSFLRKALGLLSVSVLLWSAEAGADAPKPVAVAKAATGAFGERDGIGEDVRAGKPLVIEVFVPLCSDAKGGPCGKHPGAGDPRNLEDNLYWGAVFGANRFLSRRDTGWARVEAGPAESFELERVAFKRSVSGAPWGTSGSVEVYVVLHAIDGDSGGHALERFLEVAARGGSVSVGGASERVHAVGFMGRNPLLKNGRVPEKLELPVAAAGTGIPIFTSMAHARETLGAWVKRSGSREILLPRGPVASEGYVLDAVLQGLARNEAAWSVRKRVVKAYTRWHKVPAPLAGAYFSPAPPKSWSFGADKPLS